MVSCLLAFILLLINFCIPAAGQPEGLPALNEFSNSTSNAAVRSLPPIDLTMAPPDPDPGHSLRLGGIYFFVQMKAVRDSANKSREERLHAMDQMLFECEATRRLPNDIMKIDLPWKRILPDRHALYTYENADLMLLSALRTGCSLIALVDAPVAPDWIGEWPYEAYRNGIENGLTPRQVYERFLAAPDPVSGLTGEEKLHFWQAYVESLAATWGHAIDYYEIINEPENFIFGSQGGNPWLSAQSKRNWALYYEDFYLELIRRASEAIRHQDPTATIMAGSFTHVYTKSVWDLEATQQVTMLRRMVESDLFDRHLDALSLHNIPMAYPSNPEVRNFDDVVSLQQVRSYLESQGLGDLPVWYTEFYPESSVEALKPAAIARILVLGLQYGLQAASYYKYFDLVEQSPNTFGRDEDYLVQSRYPDLPREDTPQFQSLKILKEHLTGAVLSSHAENRTVQEDSTLVCRIFHNGYQWIVAAWSNSFDENHSQILRIDPPAQAPAREYLFRKDGSIESIQHETSPEEFLLGSFETLLLVLDPGKREAAEFKIAARPDDPLIPVETGQPSVAVVGTRISFRLLDSNSEPALLCPLWSVERAPGATEPGLGVISFEGEFTPLEPGRVIIAASIGGDWASGTAIEAATLELRIVSTLDNLLRNAGFDQGRPRLAGEAPSPWRIGSYPDTIPGNRSFWDRDELFGTVWQSEKTALGKCGQLEQFSLPGAIPGDQDLMLLAWLKHEQDPLFHVGLYGFDRLRDVIESQGQGPRIPPADPVGYSEGRWRIQRGTPSRFRFPDGTAWFFVGAEFDDIAGQPVQPGIFTLDMLYVGPAKDVVVLSSSRCGDGEIHDGSAIEIYYYVEESAGFRKKVNLGWTFDLDPLSRKLIPGGSGLSPWEGAQTAFRWEDPSADVQASAPYHIQNTVFLTAEVVDNEGTIAAWDIGPPIRVKVYDSPTPTPSLPPTDTPTPSHTPVETFTPTCTAIPTPTCGPCATDLRAFVDFDVTDAVCHLRRLDTAADGCTRVETVGGISARFNDAERSCQYLYLDVDDCFAFQGNRPRLNIRIEYYDDPTKQGTEERFWIEYDASDPDELYRKLPPVELEGTGNWRWKEWNVDDAYCGNRQEGGADFRIAVALEGSRTKHFNRVIIAPHDCPAVGTATEAKIDLDLEDRGCYLKRIEDAPDGTAVVETVGGVLARRNDAGQGGQYLYFQVDDRFAFQGNRPSLQIQVEYYDDPAKQGNEERFWIEYDAADPDDFYRKLPPVILHGSGAWQWAEWWLYDAYLGNRQAGGADFRIAVAAEGSRTKHFNRISLTLHDCLPCEESPRVLTDMGITDRGCYLSRLDGMDGCTVSEEKGGTDCRRNDPSGNCHYLYFEVDDCFSFSGNRPDIRFRIEYYDDPDKPAAYTERFWVEYDAEEAPYQKLLPVELGQSGEWRWAEWQVRDAFFGNRQNGGADFRIAIAPEGSRIKHFNRIELAALGSPTPTFTPSSTFTPTPSFTETPTPTWTETETPTWTPSFTATATGSFTPLATFTSTPTPTATPTEEFTPPPDCPPCDQAREALLDLGDSDVACYLERIERPGSDGCTVPDWMEGVSCRRNDPSLQCHYLYLALDDCFARAGTLSKARIRVEYYDHPNEQGTGANFRVEYDASSPSEVYHKLSKVVLQGSGEWKWAEWVVTNAYFGNRQQEGADLRIAIANESSGMLYFNRIGVARLGGLPCPEICEVALDMGDPDQGGYLSRLEGGDGAAVAESRAGVLGRRNAPESDGYYLYFDVDDCFAFAGNRPALRIAVEYYDDPEKAATYEERFWIEYDARGPLGTYAKLPPVSLTSSGEWKWAEWTVADAWFGNRQANSADFRIVIAQEGSKTKHFNRIRIAEEASPTPTLSPTPPSTETPTATPFLSDAPSDLFRFSHCWGQEVNETNFQYDMNGDLQIDEPDLLHLLRNWNAR